jgi:hypothetical protein
MARESASSRRDTKDRESHQHQISYVANPLCHDEDDDHHRLAEEDVARWD